LTLRSELATFLAEVGPDLVGLRRDLHMHPELGWQERRTTEVLAAHLSAAGLEPRPLAGGTGLRCDNRGGEIGSAPTIGLRGDIDALPVHEATGASYASQTPGVAHACGHDVHATVVVGAGLFLARLAAAGRLPAGVRLVLQPAEELMPGGATHVIAAGGTEGLEAIFAVHCDPQTEVGGVALKNGAITSASDLVQVTLTGPGGHTARPHLTVDLVAALGDIVARVPALLSRRIDPRAGVSLVWGQISAGQAGNAIPSSGFARGTVRVLDHRAWETVPGVLSEVVRAVAAPYGVEVAVEYQRGVPPVMNDDDCVGRLARAARALVGSDAVSVTEQSLGGEDFGWYLEKVPGALARLGVCTPGAPPLDLHQPTFDVDERCIGVGVRVLVGAALLSAGVDLA
jgi:amidohydrolase